MKNRLQRLWDEAVPLGGSAPGPDPNTVLGKVDAVLDGDLDEFIDALAAADQAEKLRGGGE